MNRKRLRRTSGLISPHLLHFVTSAFVIRVSSDHRTPVNARFLAVVRFFAHSSPVLCCGGGSFTYPGGTVQT